jgi:thiosulfate dehydrogenase [quinone] large subunit
MDDGPQDAGAENNIPTQEVGDMPVSHSPMDHLDIPTPHRAADGSATTQVASDGPAPHTAAARALAMLRIAFGLTFLWAFFDKLLALGYSTGVGQDGTVDRFGDAAWIHGGSPTQGFLTFGADGPFTDFYHSIAGAAWADWLFMLALLGTGLALTLGVGMRAAAVAGGVLYLMMWSVVLPPGNNPVLDDHVLGAITVVALALVHAGDTWGLGRWWSRTGAVQRYPVLR